MPVDFTLVAYRQLLTVLRSQGFSFQTVEQFIAHPARRAAILRHDIDRLPNNALRMARLEHRLEVVSTYYFRATPKGWDEAIIRMIASLGHEIGYHYEDLSACNGNLENAFLDFKSNLVKLRKLVPVSTVCMHGSPLSRISNLDLWKRYDYKELGLVAEPYLDIDFDQVFYLTDTGRRWDGDSVSVRDRVRGDRIEGWAWPRFHSTFVIIEAVERGRFPDKVMMTVHPQRWHERPWPWIRELVWQNAKNLVKRWVVKRR